MRDSASKTNKDQVIYVTFEESNSLIIMFVFLFQNMFLTTPCVFPGLSFTNLSSLSTFISTGILFSQIPETSHCPPASSHWLNESKNQTIMPQNSTPFSNQITAIYYNQAGWTAKLCLKEKYYLCFPCRSIFLIPHRM